jgi:hypothetical protein
MNHGNIRGGETGPMEGYREVLCEEGEDVDSLGGGGEVEEVLRLEGLDGGDLDLEGVDFGARFCGGTCRA